MNNTAFDHIALKHKQVAVVSSFAELVNRKFEAGTNAICWSRNLVGDFKQIMDKLELKEDVTEVSIDTLLKLQLSEQADLARQIILNDYQLLTDFGASPSLNLIKNYQRDDTLDFISTDVYSYHIDRSAIETDTFLCSYQGVSTEILANDQLEQKILIPEIRQQLKKLHAGPAAEFENFLIEHFFDLHYQAKTDVQPLSLTSGDLWRLAVDHPTQQALPCIHRAPNDVAGEYRLLLIC